MRKEGENRQPVEEKSETRYLFGVDYTLIVQGCINPQCTRAGMSESKLLIGESPVGSESSPNTSRWIGGFWSEVIVTRFDSVQIDFLITFYA